MVRSTPLVASCALALLGAACISTKSPDDYRGGAPSSAIASRAGSYALARTAEDLERLIAEDLEAGYPAEVFDGLEAFVGHNDRRATLTGAHILWERVRPVAMLQYGGGRSQMTAVRQLGQVLRVDAAAEKQAALESLRAGHLAEVARYAAEPLGPLHPGTAELSSELAPYVSLAGALLGYRDLANADDPDPQALKATLDALEGAEAAVAGQGDARAALLANVAAAQSLERAGQAEASIEFWFRVANSPEFGAQPDILRELVAARIETYAERERRRVEESVEAERRAELEAQHQRFQARLQDLESVVDDSKDLARRGLERIEKRVQEIRDETGAGDAALAVKLAQAEKKAQDRAKDLVEHLQRVTAELEQLRGRVAAGEPDSGTIAAKILELENERRMFVALNERALSELGTASEAPLAETEASAGAEGDAAEASEGAGDGIAAGRKVGDTVDGVLPYLLPDILLAMGRVRDSATEAGQQLSEFIVPRGR